MHWRYCSQWFSTTLWYHYLCTGDTTALHKPSILSVLRLTGVAAVEDSAVDLAAVVAWDRRCVTATREDHLGIPEDLPEIPEDHLGIQVS